MDLSTAYAACEQITQREARNFSYGIRLLPAPKRQAMAAIYALARRIDDIGDGDLASEEKVAALAGARRALFPIAPDTDDPVLVAVADAARRYELPMRAFGDLLDGCELDARSTRYETIDTLVGYCRLVAGSIGQLSLAVFGTRYAESAVSRADALGVALQLTNILRDIVQDRDEMGRVYLPAQDIARFGCDPELHGPPDSVAALVAFEAGRAEAWFAEGLELLPLVDRRSRACVSAMAGIYLRILSRIQRDPLAVTRRRISLPVAEKVWVAARSLTGALS